MSQIHERLAELQAIIDKAEPDSLDHTFRARVLDLVAQLPKDEQAQWHTVFGSALRTKLRNDQTKIPDAMEVPILMPTALVDQLARICVERKVDPDSAVCEAVTAWCKENQS